MSLILEHNLAKEKAWEINFFKIRVTSFIVNLRSNCAICDGHTRLLKRDLITKNSLRFLTEVPLAKYELSMLSKSSKYHKVNLNATKHQLDCCQKQKP